MVLLLIVVAAALLCGVVLAYNRLVRLCNLTENAWSQVDVQLRRRYDLIPNLVQTVGTYAVHEASTFEAVLEARTRARSAEAVEEQGKAETVLTDAFGRRGGVPGAMIRETVREPHGGAHRHRGQDRGCPAHL